MIPVETERLQSHMESVENRNLLNRITDKQCLHLIYRTEGGMAEAEKPGLSIGFHNPWLYRPGIVLHMPGKTAFFTVS